jgi:hypothetical protein
MKCILFLVVCLFQQTFLLWFFFFSFKFRATRFNSFCVIYKFETTGLDPFRFVRLYAEYNIL